MNQKPIFQQKPQAIFFDFDGVILESSDIKTVAFVELFNHLSKEHQQAIHNYHINNMGISRFKKFEWIYSELLNEKITEEKSQQLGEGFSNLVFKKILQCPFVPGAQQLLNWAKENSLNFVASGTPQDELRKIVKERELDIYFKEVLGTPASKVEIVEAKIEKYNLDRSKCWFIGDASSDYRAAMETGLIFIARNTADYADFWKDKKGITVIEDLSEIIPVN
jgi:phosphoglycolate phosphatase-like HAD superfamily hydrolase